MKSKPDLSNAFVYLLSLVLIYTGIEKVMDPVSINYSLINSELFSDSQALTIGSLIPWVEILIGVSILFRQFTVIGLICSIVILILFSSYSFYIFFQFGEEGYCGCTNLFKAIDFKSHMMINVFLLSGSVVKLVRLKKGMAKVEEC